MIERYSRPEMKQVWDDRNKYLTWLKVELAVCEELAKTGLIPRKDWQALNRRAQALIARGGVDPRRVDFHERTTRHDVIAFTTAVAEKIGPLARYIHFGLTSSDVVDTSTSLLVQQAGAILIRDVRELLSVLQKRAREFARLPTIGRSHGIYAEPTSFGLKFLGWHAEWKRNLGRLEEAVAQLRVGKLSGAVGVNSHWSPAFEARVLKRLGLRREPVSTQVIPRDRHAQYLSTLAVCGASLERIAVELRHLQRSEVAEVQEGFAKGQKGSSAMPHKRNPISSENITGQARLLRAYAAAGLENVALWHERDISHSSVERVALPDASLVLDYALSRMTKLLQELVVNPARVARHLKEAGSSAFSGHYLLALVKAGASREQAYYWVQQCAHQSIDTGADFVRLIQAHPQVRRYLSPAEAQRLGSLAHQLRSVPEIYRREKKS
ncbi:MAG: adenylosuccinate lyase [Bacteriovoracia bacterium]